MSKEFPDAWEQLAEAREEANSWTRHACRLTQERTEATEALRTEMDRVYELACVLPRSRVKERIIETAVRLERRRLALREEEERRERGDP